MNITTLKNNSKHKAKNGGGKSNYKFGIWADKNGHQRHITTSIFGVQKTEKFILSVENGKIIFNIFSDSQAQKLEKQGITLFITSKDGKKKGVQTYHNYASIEGIDDSLFNDIVKINGGVKKYNKNKNPEVFSKYTIKRFSEGDFNKILNVKK